MYFNYFPAGDHEKRPLENPAIQLFGNRLFSDQTISELLGEFLLVAFSSKRIANISFSDPLPERQELLEWSDSNLEYAPKARLNLKLFSFLGASRLDSRHKTHRAQHDFLRDQLYKQIQTTNQDSKHEIIRTLENLLLGFQGAGSGRTWCAQSFLPISQSFLNCETIWNETKAERDNVEYWHDLLESRSSYFKTNQHLFYARGGEVLYMQICNALRQSPDTVKSWSSQGGFGLTKNEQNPEWLHAEFNNSLKNLMSYSPPTLGALAEFIDSGLEADTAASTDGESADQRFVSAGYCNQDSWPEGYLFAVEVVRLLQSNLDVIERIYLLESACAMQVLRTLAMQSARVESGIDTAFVPKHRFVISEQGEERPIVRRLSQQSVKSIEKMIYEALRSEVIIPLDGEDKQTRILKQADKSYGHKLFTGLAKRLGFIIPKKGQGARFVIDEHLLRLLVITTIPAGARLTYDTFKEMLENRYGIVFDAQGVSRANEWLNGQSIYLPNDTDSWLQEMLEAAGFLIHLSDSCALVHNPADVVKETK